MTSGDEMDIRRRIIEVVESEAPETVADLIDRILTEFEAPRELLLDQIIELQSEGRLKLRETDEGVPRGVVGILSSSKSHWFWAIQVLAAATITAIYVIPGGLYPFIYARYLLGSIFVLFLPGYSFIKALFPMKEIGNTERVALSIGSSLALVPLVGLLLNYTPWGIRLTPIALSLLVLTLVFSIVAISRQYTKVAGETAD